VSTWAGVVEGVPRKEVVVAIENRETTRCVPWNGD